MYNQFVLCNVACQPRAYPRCGGRLLVGRFGEGTNIWAWVELNLTPKRCHFIKHGQKSKSCSDFNNVNDLAIK